MCDGRRDFDDAFIGVQGAAARYQSVSACVQYRIW